MPAREIYTLSDYRVRHAQYKSDSDLQAAHARYPWLVAPDDGEVDNSWAGDIPEDDQTTEEFLQRRASAFQAFYEFMPLRLKSLPRGSSMQLYRRIRWGRLATFHMLDTRQFRDAFACGSGGAVAICPEVFDPNRSILGSVQEEWLIDGLHRSRARWDFLAQQVPFARRLVDRDGVLMRKTDAWDGYQPCQERITRAWVEGHVRNAVVLSGDVHAHWAADIKLNYDDPDAPYVGTDLVATSITSGGDGEDWIPDDNPTVRGNENVHFYTNLRGYIKSTVTPEQLQADYQCVPYISQPGATVFTRASFLIRDGIGGLTQIYDQPLLQGGAEAPTMFNGEAAPVIVSLRNPKDEQIDVTVGAQVPPGWESTTVSGTLEPKELGDLQLAITPPDGLIPSTEDLSIQIASNDVAVLSLPPLIRVVIAPRGEKVTLALDAGGPDSPLLPSYKRLSPGDLWDSTLGYGWVGPPPEYRDRGGNAVLERDFTLSRDAATLRLHIPPGPHMIYVLTGDPTSASANVIVSVNGQIIGQSGNTEIPEATFVWFRVLLDGGPAGKVADLQITSDGLSGGYWKINGIVLLPSQ